MKPVHHPAAAFAVLATLGVAACARNPATGSRQLILISEAQEIRMGQGYDREVVASLGLDPDSARQRYVQALGIRLAANSERPNLPWTFRVVDDPVVNAFALPGGFVYVTRGILAHLGSEAELAAVLGHEIGHVTARHSVSRMSTQQLTQFGLTLGVVLRPELEQYAGLASAGLGVLFLKFSRDDEKQADDLGLRYMRRGNFDPREMAGVFTVLERVSQAAGGGRVPDWLATHPNPVNRRERITQEVAALPQDFSGTVVHREAYYRWLSGLVFGDNPRAGYFRGARFFHPDLKVQFTFPEGWKTSNQRQAVLAVSPGQDALVQITLADQATLDAAARAFFSQQGLVADRPVREQIHGLPAITGDFIAAVEGGALAGSVAFVTHGGAVYRLLAYSGRARWPAYAAAAGRALYSFEPLTDPEVLNVQPLRLEIDSVERGMSLEEFAERYPPPVSLATLALVNNVEPGARFARGALVKRITGRLPPR